MSFMRAASDDCRSPVADGSAFAKVSNFARSSPSLPNGCWSNVVQLGATANSRRLEPEDGAPGLAGLMAPGAVVVATGPPRRHSAGAYAAQPHHGRDAYPMRG